MAYGVKYRLNFSDVRSRKRRVEILKNGYGGEVFPMIGTDEPVVIEWKADDDFYEPLIGSQCQLNLYVTDEVTYDQFYLFNEREYMVKVYYESAPDVYTVYWQGWVANDIYSEAITTTPYQLTVNANDGLGSLEAFDTWIPAIGEPDPTLWKFIYKNLQQIDLGFEIWISNDIRIFNESIWNNVFDDVTIFKEGVFQDNYIIQDAKKVLRSILLAFNCKIYQAYGRWIIANASSYGDQRVINGIQNGSLSGAGILAAKQGYLNSGSEDIKFEIYNAAGANTGGVTDNYLRIVPQYFKAINNNLTRLIKRPLRRYQEILNIKQKRIDSNLNASFEFEYENWDTTFGAVGTFVSDAFAGRKAIRFTGTSALGVYQTKLFSTGAGSAIKGNDYQVLISVNIDQGGSDNRLPWYLRIEYTSGSFYYWSEVNKSWGTSGSILWNEFPLDANGEWEILKATAGALTVNGTMDIGFGIPYIDASGSFVDTHIDNFAVRNIDRDQNLYNEILFEREQTSSLITTDVMEHEDVKQANIGDNIFWGQFKLQPRFKRCNDTTPKTIEEIVTQQRLNDFRAYSKSYEGTLYGNYGYLVMTLQNKIYFNWNNFQESDSAIIDSMKYNVKANTYDFLCHVPNNYTDVASVFRTSYQE